MFRSRGVEPDHGVPGSFGQGTDGNDLLTSAASTDTFDALFRSLHRSVYSYVLRSVGADDADDVLVETFTTVWLRLRDLPATADERISWVFGVAHNKLREHRRSAQRHGALSTRVASMRPQVAIEAQESVAALDWTRRLLDRLTEDERDAIALTVFAGLTPQQAASILGCPRSTLNSRTHRARERLRQIIAKEADDG